MNLKQLFHQFSGRSSHFALRFTRKSFLWKRILCLDEIWMMKILMRCQGETGERLNRSWQRRLESWRKSDKRIGGLWRWRWLVFQLLQELPPPNPCECLGWAGQQNLPGLQHPRQWMWMSGKKANPFWQIFKNIKFLFVLIRLAFLPNCCRYKTVIQSGCFCPCVGVQVRWEQQDSWGHQYQPQHAKDPSHHPQGQAGWQCFQRNHCLPDPSQQGPSI